METQRNANSSATGLQKSLFKYLKDLAEETDNARRSSEMLHYMDFCSKFYRYSPNNVWLILMQRPTASRVAGFCTWQKLNRHVIRGQKGIGVLAPLTIKEENKNGEEENRLIGFKTAFVYDISQTEGEPLPTQPNWKSLSQNDELRYRLTKYAMSKGISVSYEQFDNDTQGVSLGRKIVLSPTSGVKTLAHELVHEILHHVEKNGLSRMEREFESESAAYIICRYFGMPDLASPNYNALQGATGELILQHFHRIMHAVTEIINFIGVPGEREFTSVNPNSTKRI